MKGTKSEKQQIRFLLTVHTCVHCNTHDQCTNNARCTSIIDRHSIITYPKKAVENRESNQLKKDGSCHEILHISSVPSHQPIKKLYCFVLRCTSQFTAVRDFFPCNVCAIKVVCFLLCFAMKISIEVPL